MDDRSIVMMESNWIGQRKGARLSSKKNKITSIIDTNVFLSTGDEVFHKLKNRNIVIPLIVYRDLDKYRSYDGGLGVSARTVINKIEELRANNQKVNMGVTGVEIPGTSNTLRIEPNHTNQKTLKPDLRKPGDHDSIMMAIAVNLRNHYKVDKDSIELVTNTSSLRFQASVFQDITAIPYGDDGVKFTGRIDVNLKDYKDLDITSLTPDDYDGFIKNAGLDRTPSHVIIHVIQDDIDNWIVKDGDDYSELNRKNWGHVGPIYPRNVEQAIAVRWLNDDSIQMMSLGGVAGAGKSLLAISYGLTAVNDGRFSKVTVFRPMYAVGQQEQGFLKGDADDKIRPWSQAVWDDVRKYDNSTRYARKGKSKAASNKAMLKALNSTDMKSTPDGKKLPAIEVKYGNVISVEPLTYIRGRTFENQLVIVDDAQSLDRSILLDVVSRLGEGSKIIFTFDMKQQDNPHLSSGTSIESLNNRLAGEPEFANIEFEKSERSHLAQLASRLLSEM